VDYDVWGFLNGHNFCELEVKNDRQPRPDGRHPNRVTGIKPLVRAIALSAP
jgi:hypothetical protein